MATVKVPFPRERKFGSRGRDVRRDQLALTVAGARPLKPKRVKVNGKWVTRPMPVLTGTFGPGTKASVVAYQKAHRLPQTGIIDRRTHDSLAMPRPGKPWGYYGEYGAKVMTAAKKRLSKQALFLTTRSDTTQLIVATALLTVRHRGDIHYTQGGLRMVGVTQRMMPPTYPRWADCSSLVTWFYYVAGVEDPNGFGYNGFGNTATQEMHGQWVHASSASLASFVFYGRGGTTHVAVRVASDLVVSHGSESGPLLLVVAYRSDVRHARIYDLKPVYPRPRSLLSKARMG